MALSIMVIARVASIPLWMRSEPLAGFFINPSICFCGLWSYLGTVLNYVRNSTFKLNLLLLLFNQTWFVITLFHTLMNELYLWTLCNMWHVCWIMYDLGCVIGLFKIFRDTRRTTGFIWAQVWQCDRYGGCHCTCALINWSVLPQQVSEQDLTILATCAFKTKVFLFQN